MKLLQLHFLGYFIIWEKNENIQEKARQEINRVLPNGRNPTKEDLKELKYLNNLIKEGMRIQPPIGVLPTRLCTRDCEFEGVKLPKGTRIGIAIHTIHHHPDFWKNPESFDPERFDKHNNDDLTTDQGHNNDNLENDEHHSQQQQQQQQQQQPKNIHQHPFAYLPFSLKSRMCIGNQFSLIEQNVFVLMLLQRYKISLISMESPISLMFNRPSQVVVSLKRI